MVNETKAPVQFERPVGFYEKYIKRCLDIGCSLATLLVFGWLYIIVAVLVKWKLGSPVLFRQPRPGKIDPETGKEKIFYMYKFRSMSDERDEKGRLLPDEMRLGKFGKALRATSLDELPEVFNILKGEMSIVGPRPQLVRDMVFMTDMQRLRHTAKPGLSGLAQVSGRNNIGWEEKLNWDLKYLEKIGFSEDIRIVFQTVIKAFIQKEGITGGELATAEDLGDYLLRTGKVSRDEYHQKQAQAERILNGEEAIMWEAELVSIIMPSYNTANYIGEAIRSVMDQSYQNWELIIVDDCSTDNTDSVVESVRDPRIKYIKNETNAGAAISRNRALREARGRWIAFLDSDDLWHRQKLEKQIEFMLKKGCHFSYTNYEEIDSDGNKTNVVITGPKVISKTGMFNYCWPGCLTVMYDCKKIGLVQIENIKKNNDYAMWLKICKKAKCYLLDEVLAEYRRGRQGSISTHGYRELIKWHYRLFRCAEKQNVILSIVNTGRNVFFGMLKKTKLFRKKYNGGRRSDWNNI